jgi:hypothetical protein
MIHHGDTEARSKLWFSPCLRVSVVKIIIGSDDKLDYVEDLWTSN